MLDFSINRINEFLKIEDMSKFGSQYVSFSDGKLTAYWFRLHRKKIESSEHEGCKEIMRQYNSYVEKVRGNQRTSARFSQVGTGLLREFTDIDDLNKFDPDSDILLSNNVKAGVFFKDNYEFIFERMCAYTSAIKDQYKKYLESQKNIKLKVYVKFKREFCRRPGYDKFDRNSKILFSDGKTLMSEWFYVNKTKIANAASANDTDCLTTDSKIIYQYNLYFSYLKLKSEFASEQNYDKFSPDENVRFKSDASMNMWWEVNKERILSSDTPEDKIIKMQYNIYLSRVNKTIKVKKRV